MPDRLAISADDRRFFVLSIGLIFLAHAAAYLSHEYAHAVTAWLLGWMRSPFSIDYGRDTLANILFQQDIGDGVKYDPVFASGHGLQAALIALDGPAIGNGLLYGLCFLLLRLEPIRTRRTFAMFLFWLALMSAGNVWSYAPMRTVTTHADMALVAHGLGISTWLLLPAVTVPSLLVLWSFFFRLLPQARRSFARSSIADIFITMMSCYFYFVFFSNAGFDFSYGELCALLSIACSMVAFPLVTMVCLQAAPSDFATTTSRAAGRPTETPLLIGDPTGEASTTGR